MFKILLDFAIFRFFRNVVNHFWEEKLIVRLINTSLFSWRGYYEMRSSMSVRN